MKGIIVVNAVQLDGGLRLAGEMTAEPVVGSDWIKLTSGSGAESRTIAFVSMHGTVVMLADLQEKAEPTGENGSG